MFIAVLTMKRISLRLLLSIAASESFAIHTRDITKAFGMSQTPLCRPVYMKPPKKMGLRKDKLLKVLKPAYKIPEPPMH